eukprot:GFUD01008771.1.p1 GENE.GFUD01008771.1~~GFUD01008771.1.p1  ORF type:complete len:436 (+),score=90.14 GFUD01008771.1:42-1310(+)
MCRGEFRRVLSDLSEIGLYQAQHQNITPGSGVYWYSYNSYNVRMIENQKTILEEEGEYKEKTLESVLGTYEDEKNEENINNKEIKVIVEQAEETHSIDPWTHIQSFPCWWVVLVSLVGPVLLPLRMLCLFIIFITSYITAKLGLAGLAVNDQPLTGWRWFLQRFVFVNVKIIGGCLGIWVVKKGKQALAKDAPILVVAPHSTFVDWLVVGHTHSSPVAKSSLADIPLLGVIGRILQTVWVNREDENSKKETASQIQKRSSETGWPQTLIFPEGTNTNGRALVQFRTGAFATAKPVQPVVLSFTNKVDTLTWTWIQRLKAHHLLFLTLITPLTIITVEFLPVLSPTKEEEEQPRIFADRTRSVMCEHLHIEPSDESMKDAVAARKDFKLRKDNDVVDSADVPKKSQHASTASIDFVGNLTFGI